MEHMLMSRALWTSDGKCVPTHAGDGFASVHVTRELPAGAAFGPCVLHNGFYDTIAFIALKARDTKSNCYAFRVDPEAMRSSPLALSWLRLVQAARNRVEQNTEVFLKAGQLFFRTLRHVQEGEELMVWYNEELAHLLGLRDVRATHTPDRICCVRCGQTFQHEHPYLAHCRFLCPNNNNKADWMSSEPLKYKQVFDWLSSEPLKYKPVSDWLSSEPLKYKQVSDWLSGDPHDQRQPERCHDDSPGGRGTKSVLLEKANPSNESNIPPRPAGGDMESPAAAGTRLGTEGGVSRKEATPAGQPAEDRDAENPKRRAERCDRNLRTPERVLRGNEEQRSAFCRPHRHLGTLPTPSADLPLALEPKPAISFRNVLGSSLLYGDLPSGPPSVQPGYPYSPDQWPRGGLGVTPVTPAAPPASLPLLPPTLSPLAVAGQNWCAKCNLSFRMTSDLVLHMRSHHKREPASTMPLRRQREERMTCPVCHEHFRERHHLSRHMTSHN
ncbi:zinc finger protein 488 [Alosa pseudoharengus]|uniref:zinc finger protein 488 n=1 Tax=Alosa pseudoharengus TaxID=34774 RepID=UPI003F8992D8